MDYKSILEELRAGRSARSLAESGLASRNTIKNIVEAVGPLGWLAPHVPLPDIKVIRSCLRRSPRFRFVLLLSSRSGQGGGVGGEGLHGEADPQPSDSGDQGLQRRAAFRGKRRSRQEVPGSAPSEDP